MRRSRALLRHSGLYVALAAVALSLVFVAGASSANYGIAVTKDCVSPINVGDAYSCEFSFLNDVQTSHNTVFVDSATDTVRPSNPVSQTAPINSTTVGPTGNSNGWSSTFTVCDPSGCTVTYPGVMNSPLLSHYTAQLSDFPILVDIVTFHWRNLCDQPGFGTGNACNPDFLNSPGIAETEINPIPTATATTIHDASHTAVTSVNVGTTVHDFVSVSPVPANNPIPTGTVSIDWFTNGDCSGSPVSTGGPFALLNGEVDATGFGFTPTHAGQFAFQAHYLGDGNSPSAFTPSDGACEPLNVVDAFIQITPQNATNNVGATHTLTITVNANPATGTIAAGTATASILGTSTTGSFVGSPTCSYPGGVGSSSCTVQINSDAVGETNVQATSDISQTGVTGALTRTTGTAANTTAGCTTNCASAIKQWVDAFIQITPQDATNATGKTHTLTITVNADPATGTIAAGTATASILGTSTTGSFVGSPTCSYPGGVGSSSCTVQITSNALGETDLQATSDIAQTGVAGSLTRTTGTAANVTAGCMTDCGNAVKHWVDAWIEITPPTATNEVGSNHVLTITVHSLGGFLDQGTFPATAAIVTGPGSFVGSPSCNYTVSSASATSASCTVTITSTSPGTTVVSASSGVAVDGQAITRMTGTAANTAVCGQGGACDDAQKTWVDANIQISPLTATNPVGSNHVLTGHVNVNDGSGFVNAPSNTRITFSLTNSGGATASFVGGNTCLTSGTTGSCTVTISSPTAGTTTIQATTTVTVGGISLTTRATGDSHAGDSANASKTWVTPPPPPPPPPPPSNPAIAITKSPKSQTVQSPGTAVWTIVVTNTGNVTLTNVHVVDPQAPDCVKTSAQIPALASMAPGASLSYTCSLSGITAPLTNVATDIGTPPTGPDVTATDSAQVLVTPPPTPPPPPKPPTVVTHPAIKIVKDPKSQIVSMGAAATFQITVTNTGDVTLHDVTVTDPLSPNCDRNLGTMASGASKTYTCNRPDVTHDFLNTARVVGTSPTGEKVRDSDTAPVKTAPFVRPSTPAIKIVKNPKLQTVKVESVKKGGKVTITKGGTARFIITVTNTGNVTLHDVTVTDPRSPGCNHGLGTMARSTSKHYSCSRANVKAPYTNIANVVGTSPTGQKVRDHDAAQVNIKTKPIVTG